VIASGLVGLKRGILNRDIAAVNHWFGRLKDALVIRGINVRILSILSAGVGLTEAYAWVGAEEAVYGAAVEIGKELMRVIGKGKELEYVLAVAEELDKKDKLLATMALDSLVLSLHEVGLLVGDIAECTYKMRKAIDETKWFRAEYFLDKLINLLDREYAASSSPKRSEVSLRWSS